MNDVNLTLVLVVAALVGSGVYLLLERSLSRVLVGLVMMSNGVSIAFLVAGGTAGRAPIVEGDRHGGMSDPLPQAMVLTAIVIMLATVSFVAAMAYRSWQITGHDDVQDDVEDALIRRLAESDVTSDSYSTTGAQAPEESGASDFPEEDTVDESDDQATPGADR